MRVPLLVAFSLLLHNVAGMPSISAPPPPPDSVKVRGGTAVDQSLMKRFTPGGADSRMPSLFSTDEAEYNRFAACLAATEGLRRMRDQALVERSPSEKSEDPQERERKVADQYQANSGRVLRAMGMSVDRFNELGREISRDENLKEKVMEQAYLYRMAAMVNLDQVELSTQSNSNFQKDKVRLFCESIKDIEKLRGDQVDRLKKSLQVETFPSSISISDPTLLPFLSPKVRAVVKAFPLQAEDVVKKNGLDSTEFNSMLQEVRSNPIFRWKVQKLLKQESSDNKGDLDSLESMQK
ncbi:expressed unknown protein [Seminavis robusta]|uniref:DUF4168 domain-containing protein n=1 Tax=Seminavis robusta TaxID=568900 RepID=A0A9N8DMK7_9STRA|nr:expressed unknown protein [Seminavis robusta]|eukprot:Sro245_g097430.1 n/a (295) ;mRNA; f:48101-49093